MIWDTVVFILNTILLFGMLLFVVYAEGNKEFSTRSIVSGFIIWTLELFNLYLFLGMILPKV